jgi:hypothetical protein
MKKIITLIFASSIQKVGNLHYLVTTSVLADSSQVVERSKPFTSKKAITDMLKVERDKVDSLVNAINLEIEQRKSSLDNMQDQVVRFANQVNNERARMISELKSLRTRRKLLQESKIKTLGL